jgi:hypothetical protein
MMTDELPYSLLSSSAFLRRLADERERATKYMREVDIPRFQESITRLRKLADNVDSSSRALELHCPAKFSDAVLLYPFLADVPADEWNKRMPVDNASFLIVRLRQELETAERV